MIFSVVVPLYQNEGNVSHLLPRLLGLRKEIKDSIFEYIFVDDGSHDKTLQLLNEYKSNNPEVKIKIIKLTRNFGSYNAIAAGLNIVSGDCVGIISADLQDPPELFIEMHSLWLEGKKVIMASRKTRQDDLIAKLFALLFYKLLNAIALPQMPVGGFDFVLLDRTVVNVLNKIEDKNGSTMALIAWLGFDRAVIKYDRLARKHGKSMWTIVKRIKLFIDVFVGYTYAPIRAITYLGFGFAFISFLYATVIFYSKISKNIEVPGYSSLAIMILLLFGLTLISLGIIGEYLYRTLEEVRKRPGYVIEKVYD